MKRISSFKRPAIAVVWIILCCAFAKADTWAAQVKQIQTLDQQGHLTQALSAVKHLIDDLKRVNSPFNLLAAAFDRKASIEQDLALYREAERDYSESIRLWRSLDNGQSVGLATELNNLSSLYLVTGKTKSSEALQRESLDLRLHLLGPDNPDVALAYSNLGSVLFGEERYAESAEACKQALAIWSRLRPEQGRSNLALNTLALIELHNGHADAALPLALDALAKSRVDDNARPAAIASCQHTLALVREAAGQFDGSEQEFKAGLAVLAQSPEQSPSLVRVGLLFDYAQLLKRLNRTKEAKNLLREAAMEGDVINRTNQWQHTVSANALLPR